MELDAAATPAPRREGATAVTPVLSVRRLPTVVAEPIADRRLRMDLAAWAATVPAPGCAVVRDVEGDEVLDLNGAEPIVPASTHKLVTATAALEQLGPDHRFRTVLVGPPAGDGVVRGDVALVGGGDPVLATADYAGRYERQPQIFTDLDQLAADLAAAGVRRIEGAILGDESRYDQQRYVPGWPPRYLDQQVVGPLSALALNDGFAEYPTRAASRQLTPAADPAGHAAAVLTLLLNGRGIEVTGPPRAGPAPPDAVELAAVESPPLRYIVQELLQESDNSTAELLVKELGRAVGDPGTAGGRTQAATVLAEDGVTLDGAVIDDGSGLSLNNRVTCRLLLDLLADDETGEVLREALPVAGRSGTLQKVFVDTPLEGYLAAKTGSLNSVRALAGVVEDEDGPLPFAYVLNAPPDERINEDAALASQAALGQILLDWPRIPEIARLGPLEP